MSTHDESEAELTVKQRLDRDGDAAIDPDLLGSLRHRIQRQDAIRSFRPALDVHVDPGIAVLDTAMVDRQFATAEPREVEIPMAMQDDLRECTPQALLRDLHRPELYFDKQFELSDPIAGEHVDANAAVSEMMRTSWKLPLSTTKPTDEARALCDEVREARRASWVRMANELPNRRGKA
jgi:hypothetical protein